MRRRLFVVTAGLVVSLHLGDLAHARGVNRSGSRRQAAAHAKVRGSTGGAPTGDPLGRTRSVSAGLGRSFTLKDAAVPGAARISPTHDGQYVVTVKGSSTIVSREVGRYLLAASAAPRTARVSRRPAGAPRRIAVLGNGQAPRSILRNAVDGGASVGELAWFAGEGNAASARALVPGATVIPTYVVRIEPRPDGRIRLTDSAGTRHTVDDILIGGE